MQSLVPVNLMVRGMMMGEGKRQVFLQQWRFCVCGIERGEDEHTILLE